MAKKFKSDDRVEFNQAFLSKFADQLEEVTKAELTGTVATYSEEGELIVRCGWRGLVEIGDEYLDLLPSNQQQLSVAQCSARSNKRSRGGKRYRRH